MFVGLCVQHNYAELEALPLDSNKDDEDDTTPKCSPTRPTALSIDQEPVPNQMPNGINKHGPGLEKPPPPAEIVQAQMAKAKASPKISRSTGPAANRKPPSGKAVSRPLSTSALTTGSGKTPPNRRAVSTKSTGSPKQQRPLSMGAPKPKLATKPSAQEVDSRCCYLVILIPLVCLFARFLGYNSRKLARRSTVHNEHSVWNDFAATVNCHLWLLCV